MSESILTSIKKLLGITEECEDFDTDIIIYINTVFSILNQLGVGPKEGFKINNKSQTWDKFIGDDKQLEDVKTYVYLKVKLIFDPPLVSSVLESMNRTINEFEWRLNVKADSSSTSEKEEIQNGE